MNTDRITIGVSPVYPATRSRRRHEHIETEQEKTLRSWTQNQHKISNIPISEEYEMARLEGIMTGVGLITAGIAVVSGLSLLIYHFGWWVLGCLVGAGMIRWGTRKNKRPR